ncbi:MAG TPA: class I SAM-dependent rRNA methyltransferase [Gammaproteobacteria bacterium]|nr:class I SAM-dependent rRNA methyltransferase [Gammaproteobacteria bacterium]
MTDQSLPVLQLKKNEDRRIRQGHCWVFSNEVDTTNTPLRTFTPGDVVELRDVRGKVLGTGYVNPNSLIAARLVSRDPHYPFNASLIVHRIKVALSMREKLFPGPWYRLVFGESDGLPGLVVDRFDDVLVVQITTAGMERQKDEIVAALNKVLSPRVILLRNDNAIRDMEGLERYIEVMQGKMPDAIQLIEHDTPFLAPLAGGQKTGWFYDQYENRRNLSRWVKGARVLDVFSYVGGWGIQAARQGASSVLCVDESPLAMEYLQKNAELNEVDDIVSALQGEAFAALKSLKASGETFDVIVVDPPAFIKRRKDFKKGLEAYQRINGLAMRLLSRDGILISCSCSHHLRRADLIQALNRAVRHIGGRELQILAQGGQSADHPVHPAIPETEYLKAVFSRVVR